MSKPYKNQPTDNAKDKEQILGQLAEIQISMMDDLELIYDSLRQDDCDFQEVLDILNTLTQTIEINGKNMDKLIPQIQVDASMREQMDIAEELKHFSIEFPRLYKQLMKSKQVEKQYQYLIIEDFKEFRTNIIRMSGKIIGKDQSPMNEQQQTQGQKDTQKQKQQQEYEQIQGQLKIQQGIDNQRKQDQQQQSEQQKQQQQKQKELDQQKVKQLTLQKENEKETFKQTIYDIPLEKSVVKRVQFSQEGSNLDYYLKSSPQVLEKNIQSSYNEPFIQSQWQQQYDSPSQYKQNRSKQEIPFPLLQNISNMELFLDDQACSKYSKGQQEQGLGQMKISFGVQQAADKYNKRTDRVHIAADKQHQVADRMNKELKYEQVFDEISNISQVSRSGYFGTDALQEVHSGRICHYCSQYSKIFQEYNMNWQEERRWKIACIFGKNSLIDKENIQIGSVNNLIYNSIAGQVFLQCTIYIGNRKSYPIKIVSLKYEGDQSTNVWVKPNQINPLIPAGEQVKQELMLSKPSFRFINAVLEYEEPHKFQQRQDFIIPFCLATLMDFKDIDPRIFKAKWHQMRNDCIRSDVLQLNNKVVKNNSLLLKYWPKLIELKANDQKNVSYKLGGVFDLQKYEMSIKLIIKSNHMCIIKLIPNNKLSEELLNNLVFLICHTNQINY